MMEYLTGIFCFPFKFFFMLCICPFYLAKEKSFQTGQTTFAVRNYLPQTICCALLSIVDIFSLIWFVRTNLPKQEKNPAQFLEFFKSLLHQFGISILLKKLWFNQNDFTSIVKLIAGEYQLGNALLLNSLRREKFLVTTSCIVFTAIAFWYNLEVSCHFIRGVTCDFHAWFVESVKYGRQMFFMNVGRSNYNVTSVEGMSNGDIILGIISYLAIMHG